MSLSEAQVERYSRQIILPEIGVAGQQRLLRAHVAIDDGGGELAAVLAPYLAGAGVGRLTLHGADTAAVARAVAGLAPDTVVATIATRAAGADEEHGTARLPPSRSAMTDRGAPGALPSHRDSAEIIVAADLALADLDRVATLGVPVVAGGLTPRGGWLVVAPTRPPCVACVARQAGNEPPTPTPASAAGVIGSLLALAVIRLLLGLGDPGPPRWLLFDAAASTLEAQSFAPAAGCPVCAAA